MLLKYLNSFNKVDWNCCKVGETNMDSNGQSDKKGRYLHLYEDETEHLSSRGEQVNKFIIRQVSTVNAVHPIWILKF